MKCAIVILTLLVISKSSYAGTHIFNFDNARQLSGNWFVRDQRKWPQDPENVDWSVENGELVAISHDVCSGLSANWFLDDSYDNWRNYEMSLKFKLVKTLVPACRIYSNFLFGIHVNLATNDCFMLSLETSGAGGAWNKVVLGTSEWAWRNLPSLKAPLEEGEWHTLRMIAIDGNYQGFIDDELIIETKSPIPNSARGLAIFGIKNAEMHFDDFTITGEDIPEILSPASQNLITRLGLKPMIPENEMQQQPEKSKAISPGAKLSATWGQIRRTN